jgi:hypothetical protein
MREQRARMSRHAEVGKAMDYMLTRWDAFSRSLFLRLPPQPNARRRRGGLSHEIPDSRQRRCTL